MGEESIVSPDELMDDFGCSVEGGKDDPMEEEVLAVCEQCNGDDSDAGQNGDEMMAQCGLESS